MKRLTLMVTLIFAAAVFCIPGQGLAKVYGGTATLVMGSEPDRLDPANADSNPSEAVNRMIYDNLAKFDDKLKIVPGLAQKWDISRDSLTYTFYLQKGVKFHDGTPFNAEAVKIFFDRMTGPEKPSRAGLYAPFVSSVEVVDEHTIKVTLKKPFVFFLNNIAHSASGIVSPAALKQWGPDVARHPVGTGPFKFVEWVQGDHITLARNDEYWGGKPYLDKVIVKAAKEDSARVMMLQSGDAQTITHIPSEDITRLAKDPNVKLDSKETLRVLYVGINVTKKPFSDIRVRQALNYGVDKEAIVKNVYQGKAKVSPGVIPPLATGYMPVKGYPYDPEKAKKLLAEAGYPNGFKAKFWSPNGRYPKDYELAQAVQQQLKKIGVDLTLETMEFATYVNVTKKPREENQSELFLFGWAPSSAETRWILYPLFSGEQLPPTGNNRSFYDNKEFDDLINKFSHAPSKAEMDRNLKLAQEMIIREAPAIYLLVTHETVGMSKKIHDVINSTLELTYFDNKTYLEK